MFTHNPISWNRHRVNTTPLIHDQLMVPRGRVELPLSCENRILSSTPLPFSIETIDLYRLQSVTYKFLKSDARKDRNICHPIVTVQSTGQSQKWGIAADAPSPVQRQSPRLLKPALINFSRRRCRSSLCCVSPALAEPRREGRPNMRGYHC